MAPRKRQLLVPDPDVMALMQGIAALLHPFGEVVLHDVAADRIAAIINPFSRRVVGDPSLLSSLPSTDGGVLGPYEKVNTDGHRIVSVSIPVADGRGLVCINLDRQPLDGAMELLQRFVGARVEQPTELFERDWHDAISVVVDDWCRRHQRRRDLLTRTERLSIVSELDGKGLFATRGAASHVAHTLDSSRSLVYQLLKEARQ
jgi:D-arginine utilization repressor